MQACFFGETVSVPSRILDQDEEEDDNIQDPSIKNYEIQMDGAPSKVIFAGDKLSKAFCKVYLMSSSEVEPIGHIYETDENKEEDHRVELFGIYRTPEASTVLVLSKGPEPIILNKFAKSFLSKVGEKTQIFILVNDHLSAHKTPEPQDVPFESRILKSSACKASLKIPRLSEPNFVSGLPAALLSYSEHLGREALLLLSFTDTFEPDSISISGFLPLLKITQPIKSELSQERLKKLAFEIHTDQIYM
eukprot:TRINITY_DN2713_c0_g1_i1.p1 TRINITY_DN2713_c0_g1~~TRINITY_DN2713_c0_g1_i1.p1  ORF type:complete len:248 (+),score=61.60 TRINITY_DN2713_c0_g1_i1:105-848(+)